MMDTRGLQVNTTAVTKAAIGEWRLGVEGV
jgi:hypothetical protein